jgi:hypothetical protein
MTRDFSLDRWEEFIGLATYGKLGKPIKAKLFAIPGEKRELLKKVVEAAVKAGQAVQDNGWQLGYYETIREIGLRAFQFGWMTDDGIDDLIKKGGWKEKD